MSGRIDRSKLPVRLTTQEESEARWARYEAGLTSDERFRQQVALSVRLALLAGWKPEDIRIKRVIHVRDYEW